MHISFMEFQVFGASLFWLQDEKRRKSTLANVAEKETEVVDLTVEANSVPPTVPALTSDKKASGKAEDKSKVVLASGKKAKSSYR